MMKTSIFFPLSCFFLFGCTTNSTSLDKRMDTLTDATLLQTRRMERKSSTDSSFLGTYIGVGDYSSFSISLFPEGKGVLKIVHFGSWKVGRYNLKWRHSGLVIEVDSILKLIGTYSSDSFVKGKCVHIAFKENSPYPSSSVNYFRREQLLNFFAEDLTLNK